MQSAQKKATENYKDLRIRLLHKGHSLRSFALLHGYPIPTVYDAARGTRKGRKSIAISNHLRQFVYAE